jgi:hypothetical protein
MRLAIRSSSFPCPWTKSQASRKSRTRVFDENERDFLNDASFTKAKKFPDADVEKG